MHELGHFAGITHTPRSTRKKTTCPTRPSAPTGLTTVSPTQQALFRSPALHALRARAACYDDAVKGRVTLLLLVGCVLGVVVLGLRTAKPRAPRVEQRSGSTSGAASSFGASRRGAADQRPVAVDTTPIAVGWGSGRNQVGRRRDPESVSEGPMSFTHGKDGSLYILDQVNHRVLRRGKEGTWLAPIELGGVTAQDLRVDGQGGVAVLDRLGEKSLARYDAAGNAQGGTSLLQLGLVDPAGATGLFDDDTGRLYVEESLQGQGKRIVHAVDGGPALPGRPSRDGTQRLAAAIVSRAAGQLVVRAFDDGGKTRWESPLTVPPSLLSIVLCDTDSNGNVYIGVLHARPAGTELVDEQLDVWRLRSDGTTTGHASLAHPDSGLDQLHELSVGSEGTVWWMHAGADGEVVEAIAL